MISVQSQHTNFISGFTPLDERMAMSVSFDPTRSDQLSPDI
jgi:hypothetical protein